MYKEYPSLKVHLFYNLLSGIAWSFGASIGFALLIWVLTSAAGTLGGIPIIGEFIANIIGSTNQALDAQKNIR